MFGYLFTSTPMPQPAKHDEKNWYDTNVITEILIQETPAGQKYAPYVSNLCVGFPRLTLEGLQQELDDLRVCWPFLFPKAVPTRALTLLVKEKYPKYRKSMELQNGVL